MEDICVSNDGHKILYDFKNVLEGRHKVKILMPDIQNPDLCVSEDTIFVKIVGNVKNIRAVQRFLDRKLAREQAKDDQVEDQSVIILNSDSDDDGGNKQPKTNLQKTKKPPAKKRRTDKLDLVQVSPAVNSGNQSPPCEVTSTTKVVDESVIILDESVAAEEFIPIRSNGPSFNKVTPSANISPEISNDIIVISSDEEETVNRIEQLPRAIPTPQRQLRPIVIDGSNVARTHGKPQNTFSCKGIEICINYFLQRGHPQVTAFVPLFRRHCKNGRVCTTDQDILERFEKTQNVVFTPSRRLESGVRYSCYDDRFIVELAASNGGVILSNDNYKDLLGESPAFADTIRNRLLMYCFVGDMLMIPGDPLGLNGPKLDEYLSFPPAALGSGS